MQTETMTNNIIQIGNIRKPSGAFTNPQCGRIYSVEGLAPTLNTVSGGGHEPKILVKINYDENGEKMSRNQMVCEERCDEGLRVFKDEAIGTIRTIDSGEINV